jgi:hypothetical protein
MKDVSTDRESEVRSAAVLMGVEAQGDRIILSRPFLAMALVLKGLFTTGIATLSYLVFSLTGSVIMSMLTMTGSVFVFGHSLSFLGPRIDLPRGALLRTFSVHEILSFTLSVLAISPILGPFLSLGAILVPVLWFTALKRFMYSRALVPGV